MVREGLIEVTCDTDLKEAKEQVVCISKGKGRRNSTKVLSWNSLA